MNRLKWGLKTKIIHVKKYGLFGLMGIIMAGGVLSGMQENKAVEKEWSLGSIKKVTQEAQRNWKEVAWIATQTGLREIETISSLDFKRKIELRNSTQLEKKDPIKWVESNAKSINEIEVEATAEEAPHLKVVKDLKKVLKDEGVGMDFKELAYEIEPIDPFMALTVIVENIRLKVYEDPGGLNIGMGYCITKRKAIYGEVRVRQDFKDAGLKSEQIEQLLSKKRSEAKKVIITPMNALALLEITKQDYEELARNAIGMEHYESLTTGQKAGLTYLAYNTGSPGAFGSVIKGLKEGKSDQAILGLTIKYKDEDGVWQSNERGSAWIRVFFAGEKYYKKAIENPMEFEGGMANAASKAILAKLVKTKPEHQEKHERGLAFMRNSK